MAKTRTSKRRATPRRKTARKARFSLYLEFLRMFGPLFEVQGRRQRRVQPRARDQRARLNGARLNGTNMPTSAIYN